MSRQMIDGLIIATTLLLAALLLASPGMPGPRVLRPSQPATQLAAP